MQFYGNIMGLRLCESFQGPLTWHQIQLQISFGDINLFSMEDYAPFIFLGSWALVALYLSSKFHLSIQPFCRSIFFKVERGPHLFQSCLRATRDGLLHVVREMHFSFENLTVSNTLDLQAFLMDIHHDTSLKSIFEDDSISLTFRAHICFFFQARGQGYGWLLSHLFIRFTLHTLFSP